MDLAVIFAALAVGAFVKGLTGTGLPQVAIPVMAAALGVERAVIIMSIPGVLSNVWLVVTHAGNVRETRHLPSLLATGILGAAIGTVALTIVDTQVLALVLASLILAYVALRISTPRLHLSLRAGRWLSPPVGLAAGALQGATGVSGPLLSTYVHSLGLKPPAYVFSVSALFFTFSLVQVVTLIGLDAYTSTLVAEGLLAMLPVAVFLPLGARLGRRLDPAVFGFIVLAGLALAATVLLWQALRG